jgi:hypothetical protein
VPCGEFLAIFRVAMFAAIYNSELPTNIMTVYYKLSEKGRD